MKNKFKQIYKTFYNDAWYTLKCAMIINLILLGIYLIFALLLNYVGSFQALDFLSYLLFLILLSLIASFIEPFIYSYFAVCGGLHGSRRDELKLSSFLKTTRIGKQIPFKGQLRIWNTLLFSIIIYFGITVVTSGILMILSTVPGSELYAIFEELNNINYNDTVSFINGINTVMESHYTYIRFVALFSNFPAILVSFYYFIHKISVGTFKYYIAPTLRNAPPQAVNIVLKRTIKENKSYYKGYYFILFPLTILFATTFSLTYFLFGLLSPNLSVDIVTLTSIIVTLIVIIPFMPLVFNYHEMIRPKFMSKILATFIQGAESELDVYKRTMERFNTNSENDIKEFEKALDAMKKSLSHDQENDDEKNKDEDNKKD